MPRKPKSELDLDQLARIERGVVATPLIQWYPGHIAKAEKALQEQLSRVDVVLEVRDARIPLASFHPQIPAWIGTKPRLLILNRVDMISPWEREQWQAWFRAQGESPYCANGQTGDGVMAIFKAAQAAGVTINERRKLRGMNPRPVRAVVLGFPNVGKSALINRLLKRKIAASAARPGVTRQLRWIRISDQLELLDAPGVLPANLKDQNAAIKLAICDDIGEAAYDNQRVAAALVDLLQDLNQAPRLLNRYQASLGERSGEEYIVYLATQRFQKDNERTGRQLLQDFRRLALGPICLERPPSP
ncbi:ribosome biogenesis GTPase YlqF [Thermosynechococcaceae cyanobacterium BACA0444]|uniref:Ribosome biogenesis GTPase A n=1 Tax=Pseudocalidococcus azoricus BACA0444 TaxID=2918990 RepID=A0AAE4FUL2_9CYAN|nr:ribosome biogenesis GTPase YlqF [Pseudocalidococcus azoricus]MDS3861190.1 ribosome biogenesis GTPase YlqF [Pseudocalidococcus azoricus BACA0444]